MHTEPRLMFTTLLSDFLPSSIMSFGTFCSASFVQRFSPRTPQNWINKCSFFLKRKKSPHLFLSLNLFAWCRPPAQCWLSLSEPIVMASSLLASVQNYHLFHSAKQERKSNCLWFQQSCVAERLPGCCSWVRCPCPASCSPVITVMPQRKPNRNLCLMSESGDECNRRSCAGVKRSGG